MSRKIRTALISVSDKSGLAELAKALQENDVKILSSSGTRKFLSDNGVDAIEIAEYTNSDELLGGRVKTLHPKIHAGILANRSIDDHNAQLKDRDILPIDLVVVNLYPFREKYRDGGMSEEEMVEFVDIGGITLIRAAAKNFRDVTVLTDSLDYATVTKEVRASGGTTIDTRRVLARKAFTMTSTYDAAIESYFNEQTGSEKTPLHMSVSLHKVADLRYGENPHQFAAAYSTGEDSPMLNLEKHQGKALSFNNYLDLLGAFALARDLGPGSVGIIKHTNPCGAAWCGEVNESFRRALATDRVSAFGGVVAVNGPVGGELAEELNQLFLEVVLAREFSDAAHKIFVKKKNLRVISIPDTYWVGDSRGRVGLMVEGFFLLQEIDAGFPELDALQVVTKREPTDKEFEACRMGWKVAKHVKSNSIVIADEEGTVGIGAGQMSRVDSSQIATRKAHDAEFSLTGKTAASDAFFPFADGVTTLARAGITAIIQPGGSIRDQEVIEAADEANISMIFTGRRHFRHL